MLNTYKEQEKASSAQTGKSVVPGEQVCIVWKKELFSLIRNTTQPEPELQVQAEDNFDFPEQEVHTATSLNAFRAGLLTSEIP